MLRKLRLKQKVVEWLCILIWFSKDAWQIGAKVHKKCRGALKWKGPNVLDLVSTAIDPYA